MVNAKCFHYLPLENSSPSPIFARSRVVANPVFCPLNLCRFTDEADKREFHILVRAIALFEGDAEAAIRWLMEPNRALAWQQPAELMASEEGGAEILSLILRIDYGVYS